MAALNKMTIVSLFLVVMVLVGQLNQVECCRQRNAENARTKIQQLLAAYPELNSEIFSSSTASSVSSSTTAATIG